MHFTKLFSMGRDDDDDDDDDDGDDDAVQRGGRWRAVRVVLMERFTYRTSSRRRTNRTRVTARCLTGTQRCVVVTVNYGCHWQVLVDRLLNVCQLTTALSNNKVYFRYTLPCGRKQYNNLRSVITK